MMDSKDVEVTLEIVDQAQKMFRFFDQDGNGVVQQAQVVDRMIAIGMRNDEGMCACMRVRTNERVCVRYSDERFGFL